MVFDLNNLPSDIPVLHKMLAALNNNIQSLITENQSLTTENQSLTTENQSLREQLALLKAKRYGKSSEKLDKQIEEIELKIEENELILGFKTEQDNVNSDKSIATVDDSKQKPKRQKLPEHLPREAAVLKPVDQCPACGGVEFRKISDDISETLEYVPSSFKVIRHVRPRCACTHCEKIVQAYAPSKAIDKGKPGSGLLAHILIQKYCNHLPLYRQSQIYEREGVEISRTTMASWAGQCARLLEPIAKAIQQCIFSGKQIHLLGLVKPRSVEYGPMYQMVDLMGISLQLQFAIFIALIGKGQDRLSISKILQECCMLTLMLTNYISMMKNQLLR